MRAILSVAAALCALAAIGGPTATTVTFPAPANSLYALDEDIPSVALPRYLERVLLSSDAFEVVRYEDPEDAVEANLTVGWTVKDGSLAITVKTAKGESSRTFAPGGFPSKWDNAFEGAVGMIEAASGASSSVKKEISSVVRRYHGVATTYFFLPGIVNTVNANDGELRFDKALAAWKASKHHPLMAEAVMSAAKRRAENKLPAVHLDAKKAMATAVSVIEDTPGYAASETVAPRRTVTTVPPRHPTEHPYLARRKLEAAAKAKDWSSLEQAAESRDFSTRMLSVRLLAKANAARGRKLAAKLLRDKDEWVRFESSLTLSRIATQGELAAISAAMAHEENPATKLYLADARAKANGSKMPAAQPAANVPGRDGRVTVWNCGFNGAGAASSPYGGYYTCAAPTMPNEAMKKKCQAGASVFPRMWPAANPGQVLTQKEDIGRWRFLLTKCQLKYELLPWTDGCVYGEENMTMCPNSLWKDGWRLFCLESKIDPEKIGGERGRLTPEQEKSFWRWGQRLAVEGFNEIYDFTHDYFGKLRPGFQVCTFMPGENYGETPFDSEWKFDLGGAYIYDGDAPIMYARCQRFRKAWPERPLMWLGYGNIDLGIGGSVYKSPIFYSTATPQQPFAHTYEHYYMNNLIAWIAGADPGFFTHYEGALPGGKVCGGYLQGEGIAEGSHEFDYFLTYLFTGALEHYRVHRKRTQPDASSPSLDGDDEVELDDSRADDEKAIADMRVRMRKGFLNCQRATDDAARVFVGLPRTGGKFSEANGLYERVTDSVSAYVAASSFKGAKRLTGCELLTGEWNVTLTSSNKAALVAREYQAPYVVVHDGIAVLARSAPFASVKLSKGAIEVVGSGEVRVTRQSRPGAEIVMLKPDQRDHKQGRKIFK